MGGRTRQDSDLHDARSDVLDCISEIHIIPPRDLSCDRYGRLDTKMLSIESVGGDTRSALPRSTSFKAASQVNRHFVRISDVCSPSLGKLRCAYCSLPTRGR